MSSSGARTQRWGSGGSEEFQLIDAHELVSEPQQQPQRRTGRLARLLGRGGPWRRAAAAPPPAGAGAGAQSLKPIPIVSLEPSNSDHTVINPLSSATLPGGTTSRSNSSAGGAQRDSSALEEATVGTWLQEQPAWGLPPPSHASSSLCSGISICSSSEAGSGGSSAMHSRGSSCSWPPESMGSEVGHNGGSSSHRSSSRLLNLLMLQAEAGAVSPEPKLLPAAQAADCTPNPLLQQEQAALLSWRRHAWHAGEQRQPELLHRLLSSGWDEEQAAAGAAGAAASAALLTSSGMASRPGKGGTFGRLLAIIAALAVAVLLLHAAHSDAAHRKLTEPHTGLAVYGEEAAALHGSAALLAAGASSLPRSSSSGPVYQPIWLDPRSVSSPEVAEQLSAAQRLPRRRLRLRRLVLLIEWE